MKLPKNFKESVFLKERIFLSYAFRHRLTYGQLKNDRKQHGRYNERKKIRNKKILQQILQGKSKTIS